MPQAARKSDQHFCPRFNNDGTPHIGGEILPSANNTVIIEGLAAATLGDKCKCNGPLDNIAVGSSTVFIKGKSAARLGDATVHGGHIIGGAQTVFIGG